VLHHAVVVAGDGARADVGEFADVGVANIGQVADLDAFVEDGVLDFDEVANMHVFSKFRAGAQSCEGADLGATADVAAFQMAEALDFCAGLNRDTGAEDDVGADDRVAADMGAKREEHGVGGGEGGAVFHRLGPRAGLEGGLGPCEFGARVDAEGFGFVAKDDPGGKIAGAGERDDVGQVVFRARIVIGDGCNECGKGHGICADNAGIAEGYGALFRRCILEFDDLFQTVASGDKPAIATGIGGVEAEDNDGMLAARVLHGGERLSPDKGGVAVKNESISCKISELRGGRCDGMGGAQLFGLDHHGDAVVERQGRSGDGFGLVTRHNDDAVGVQGLPRGQRVVEKGGGTYLMEDLGQVGIHPCALTCGQNDQCDGHFAPFLAFAHLLPRKRGAARGRPLTDGYRMRTVVFDLDGTLADTSADLLAAANVCFRGMGHGDVLGPADALVAFHGGRAMLRAGYARLGLPMTEGDVDRLYPVLLAAYADGIDTHTRLYPGVISALEVLAGQGYRLAICTNKPAGLAEVLVSRLGIRGMFGSLVGADTLAVRKPDVAPYRLAVQQAGGMMAQSMLVGDTETDRRTGLAAGVPVALVTFGPEGAGVARMGPEALLDHYDDLPELAGRLVR
jgi:phosphoglycolate phosphatase